MKGLEELRNAIKSLKKINETILVQADAFVELHAPELIQLNRDNLANGIDSKEVPLDFKKPRLTPLNSSRAYTKAYARIKSKYGGQTNFVDLRLLGGFYQSIIITRLETGHFTFNSEIDIFPYLVANYGDEILGITEKQLAEFAGTKLKPHLQQVIDKLIP